MAEAKKRIGKGKFRYMRVHGKHTMRIPGTRGVTVIAPGDEIEVNHPSKLGNTLDCWKLMKSPKRKKKEKVTLADQMLKIGGLPHRTVDGIITAGFLETGDMYVFNKREYPVFQNPKSKKKYWLSDEGYLSPVAEGEDDLELDKSGDVKTPAPDSDVPEAGLTAVHVGGGWYDVINDNTGEPINDRKLRKKAAMRLADGKTKGEAVGGSEDMEGKQGVSTRRRIEPDEDPE